MNTKKKIKSVIVKTYARLHMGFLDLNGEQDRHFGSIGLSLNQPVTQLKLSLVDESFVSHPPDAPDNYITKSKQLILAHLGIDQAIHIEVMEEIPRHAGLGSGTQMALAIGDGINQLLNANLSLNEIAQITNRGARSGIGIGTYAKGGLVLDGGRGERTTIPPIIAQHHFPSAWRVILIFDPSFEGVNGQEERNAFKTLEKQSLAKTDRNMHHVLMQALPAVVEADLVAFGQAISTLQVYNGDYFSPVQNGRYASLKVTEVLAYLTKSGVGCTGQSSWGPTGFAIVESEAVAEQHLEELKVEFQEYGLSWMVCQASNTGATVNM